MRGDTLGNASIRQPESLPYRLRPSIRSLRIARRPGSATLPVASPESHRPLRPLILDMARSVSETCGQQEGSMYNGHFACECCHPLFVSNG